MMKHYGKHLLVTLGLVFGLGTALALVCLLAHPSQPAQAQSGSGVIRVATTGSDAPACGGEGNPCRTVQYAVDLALPGEEIRVATGIYGGVNSYAGLSQVVYISKTVTVRGGYTTADWTTPDPQANPTTLHALQLGRVLYITGDISPTIEGLRIIGGDASGLGGGMPGVDGCGGGVYIDAATATISGCLVFGNTASTPGEGNGGGLHVRYGSPTLSGNTIFSNTASSSLNGDGGGVSAVGGNLTLSGNTFVSNTASATGEGRGGGLFLHDSNATLTGDTIVSNTASTGSGNIYGGGLYIDGGSGTLSGNTIIHNTASTTSGAFAGGLYIYNSSITLSGNTVQGNTASTAGWGVAGGLYVSGGSPTLSGNTVQGNTASSADSGSGGGLYIAGGSPDVSGNTIVSNTASTASWGRGGGLYLSTASPTLSGNTVQGNTASTANWAEGGGLYISAGSPTLNGNTVQRNTASTASDGEGGGLWFSGSDATLSGNRIISNTAALNAAATGWGGGLRAEGGSYNLTNNVVAGNHANTQGSGLWFSSGTSIHAHLLHNTIAGNHSSGQGVYVGTNATLALTNTIVSGHAGVGINVSAGSSATMQATLWYGNVADTGGGGTINTSLDVYGNPVFADPANRDYHLGSGSAAIDTGVDAGVTEDLDGLSRPQGCGYDIGAYEHRLAITGHSPQVHQVGVALSADIQATFDGDVNTSTVTSDTFVVHGHLGGMATGSFAYDGGTRSVTLDPGRTFHAGEVLRATATARISSTCSSPLQPYGWQFTAGPVTSRSVAGFTDIGAALTGVDQGSVAWGDYDNDEDLDILLTGGSATGRVSKVYRNDGAGSFADIGAGLTNLTDSCVAWGDYDNDGDLDILITGQQPSSPYVVSKIYRNDGGGAFTDIGAGLTGVRFSSVAWGDYDNDGDLDILLTGSSNAGRISKVYRNDAEGSGFTDIGAALTGVSNGSVGWGDYDNDGDLDILLTGDSDGDPVSQVYRNDGGDAFADIGAGLTGVEYSSVAWGDYDNDGDLDILLTGRTVSPPNVSKVYRNDGASGFTDILAGLKGVVKSSVAWGDYDNDGDLDILLTGFGSSPSRIYRNDGGSSGFTDIGADLPGVQSSSVAWGDYDNDGDVDILLTGYDGSAAVSKVYRNDDCLPELGVSKEVDNASPQPGQVITYTIVVSNSGDLEATGVVVSDTVPGGLTFAGPVSLDPPGAGTTGTPPILVYDATIAAGGSITVTFPVTVNMYLATGTVITNTTAVTCSEVPTPAEGSVPITVANARPRLGTVDPSSGNGPTGVTTYFTTTWMDANGWQNLKQCYFHIGDSPSIVGNVTLMYNAAKNKLWMRTDDGTAWSGGYAPESANTMENSQAIVHCNLTTMQGDGDTLSVTWAIEFKAGYTGAKKTGLKCKDRDKAKAKGKWMGSWTITP
jgi:uncharacterized repeat protein (TIGR01451 family)